MFPFKGQTKIIRKKSWDIINQKIKLENIDKHTHIHKRLQKQLYIPAGLEYGNYRKCSFSEVAYTKNIYKPLY